MTSRNNDRVILLCRAAILLAFLCIIGMISVFFGAIPFSLSLFGVLLIGFLLPPLDAFFTLCAYLLLGSIGLPIFAGMRGGMDILLGPTGGFLLTYPFVACLLSFLMRCMRRKRECGFFCTFTVSLLPLLLCYLGGGLWYSFLYAGGDVLLGFSMTVVPFIPMDLCKMALATWVSRRLRHFVLSA